MTLTKQTLSSAATSINDRLPAIIGLMNRRGVDWTGADVLDYGCGRFPGHVVKYAMDHGARGVKSYDKYNGVNRLTGRPALAASIVLLSNVLNVINSAAARASVLRDCYRSLYATPGAAVYVTVYEGDGTGVGKQTGSDSWQENRKTSAYVDEIRDALPGAVVERHGKLIIIRRA